MADETSGPPSSQVDYLPEVMPLRSDEVEVADFGTEFVVFDPRNRMAHHLVAAHALVFDACDGISSSAELVADIVASGGFDDAAARTTVALALRQLSDLGLLHGTSAPVPPPCLGCGSSSAAPSRSRRSFSRR